MKGKQLGFVLRLFEIRNTLRMGADQHWEERKRGKVMVNRKKVGRRKTGKDRGNLS